MNPKELTALRNERLQRQMRYQLYAFAPFYRRRIDEAGIGPDGISKVEDLVKLPPVDRAVLSERLDQFSLRPTRRLIQRWGASSQLMSVSMEMVMHGSRRSELLVRNEYEPVHWLETAGTTGNAIKISLSKRDLTVLGEQGRRMLQIAGVQPEDRIVNLLPSAASGGFWTTWLGGVSLGVEQSALGPIEPYQGFDHLNQGKGSVLISDAGLALAMLQAAWQPPPSLRTIILAPRPNNSAEVDALRAAAGAGVNVVSTYHFAEGRAVWSECAEGKAAGGFHTFPDLDIVEVVDPETGRPADPDNGGELVFTGLEQRGTAVARYRPGDMVGGIQSAPCPYCGRLADRIMGPVRRMGGSVRIQVATDAPVEIDRVALQSALNHPDLAAWQVQVSKMDGGRNGLDDVLVLYRPKAQKDPGVLAVELEALLRKKLGLVATQFILSDVPESGLVDLR